MKPHHQTQGQCSRNRIRALALASIALPMLLPAVALAQSAPEAAVEDVSTPGDIVVTARKRAESALSVPVIATILTAETIDRAAIISIQDIVAYSPGLQAGGTVLANGTQVAIRGFGTAAYDPGTDQSVSLNIDGLSFSHGLAFQSGSFDVAQIEVLKGPQSLFFGKSSPAGVISIRTADPGDKLEVMARTGYEFEANELRGEAVISGPVTDTLGMRLAVAGYDGDGFFFNRAIGLAGTGAQRPGKRIGGGHGHHVRGTVVFKPSSAFDARLKINRVEDRTEYGATLQMASCPEGIGASPGSTFPASLDPREDCRLDRTAYLVDLDPAAFPLLVNDGHQFNKMKQTYGSLELNFRPAPDITLTSVSGYYDATSFTLYNTLTTGYAGPGIAHQSTYEREEFTQEFRVNTDFSGPLNVTGGAFYQDGKASLLQPIYGNLAYVAPALTILSRNVNDLNIKSWAVFGQARFQPTQELELSAGGRYTNEERTNSVVNLTTGRPIPIAVPKLSSKRFAPEATVTYKPSGDLTLFASYKVGYKSGSYTMAQLPAATPPALPDNSYRDEKVSGGEAGVKARLLDRQVVTNLAAYYYKVTGFQVGASVRADSDPGSLPVARTVNAGAGRLYGIDFDVNYRPRAIDGLSLHGAFVWNKSKFTDLNNVPCYGGQTIAEGCNQAFNTGTGRFTAQDLSGTPFLRSPEWQANFGFAYELPVANDWKLTLANDNSYTSLIRTVLGRRTDFVQRGNVKADLSATLTGPQDRWEVALIGKNVTNKITTSSCFLVNGQANFFTRNQITGGTVRGADGIDELACSADRGRSIWLRLTLRPFNQ